MRLGLPTELMLTGSVRALFGPQKTVDFLVVRFDPNGIVVQCEKMITHAPEFLAVRRRIQEITLSQ